MLLYHPGNNMPFVYTWQTNGVNNGNVTITYENMETANKAIEMFNEKTVLGQKVTAVLTQYHLPYGKSQFQKGTITVQIVHVTV